MHARVTDSASHIFTKAYSQPGFTFGFACRYAFHTPPPPLPTPPRERPFHLPPQLEQCLSCCSYNHLNALPNLFKILTYEAMLFIYVQEIMRILSSLRYFYFSLTQIPSPTLVLFQRSYKYSYIIGIYLSMERVLYSEQSILDR